MAKGRRGEERRGEERETAALFLFCVVLLQTAEKGGEGGDRALFSFQDIM